jgi:hypothetical protein
MRASPDLELQVRARAKDRCEHVVPLCLSGTSELSNVALAWPACDLHKAGRVEAIDEQTGKLAPLFNPRTNAWMDHFRFEGYITLGLSPMGRATVRALYFNQPRRLQIRRAEVLFGLFSPDLNGRQRIETAPLDYRTPVRINKKARRLGGLKCEYKTGVSLGFFFLQCFDIEALFGKVGQQIVRLLFFFQVFFQQTQRFRVAHFFGPGAEAAVGGDLVVFNLLRGADQPSIQRGAVFQFARHLFAFGD